MPRLYIVGGAATDIIGRPFKPLIPKDSNPGHISISFGGVGYNLAHNAVKLGQDVVFNTRFGEDVLGELHRQQCQTLGMDLSYSLVLPKRSAKYVGVLDDQGDMYSAVADVGILDDVSLTSYDAMLADMHTEDVCIVEGNLSQEVLVYLVEHSPCRMAFEPISTAKAQKVKLLFPKISIFKPNRLEAESLLGYPLESQALIKQALGDFAKHGVEETLISDGARGVYLGFQEQAWHLQSTRVDAVNATGAGDALFAVYVSLRNDGYPPLEACELAMCAASLTLQVESTVHPDLSIQRLLDHQAKISFKRQAL